eukprot:TRINITY_DN4729_c0_g2_i2.p1 TRINITY_DN4729_c0_g2~~TRINITY_DN4729_c0_g2_i2.p1  ORF type:complete len:186 (+),score=34.95 TRINITY_DN4729_c0_g2_i2:396-953(+)
MDKDAIEKVFGEHTEVVDLDIHAEILAYRKFDPKYPVNNIPIPFTPIGKPFATSVMGVYSGLKKFSDMDSIDSSKFNLKGGKNFSRKLNEGVVLQGWQKGIHGKTLLGPFEARKQLFVDVYHDLLATKLSEEIGLLKNMMKTCKKLVLLDRITDCDLQEKSGKLVSHAYLVKLYLEGKYPEKTNK